MSLEICQHLGEKLDNRETCLMLCYRFPDCLAEDEPAQDPGLDIALKETQGFLA
jgi:hypothetical protein